MSKIACWVWVVSKYEYKIISINPNPIPLISCWICVEFEGHVKTCQLS